jgi:hypothetical protein
LRDSDRAINAYEEAASATGSHMGLALTLGNLANALGQRVERTHSTQDLHRAIENYDKCLQLLTPNNFNRGLFLYNKGRAMQKLFDFTGSERAIQAAIAIQQEAVETDPGRAPFLDALGSAFIKAFGLNNDPQYFEAAVENYELAINAVPDSHPEKCSYLSNLGVALKLDYQKSRESSVFVKSMDSFERAMSMDASRPTMRVQAARNAVDLFQSNIELLQSKLRLTAFIESRPQLLPLLKAMVKLLPKIIPRALDRKDEEFNIAHGAGIASITAAMALEKGEDPVEALRLLETGRGVMASRQLEARSDVTILAEEFPHLAERFNALLNEINRPRTNDSAPTRSGKPIQPTSSRLHTASIEFDALIDEIRSKPGRNSFLIGLSASHFMALAVHPIVVFNVTPFRSDAIIVTSPGIRSIHLPNLKQYDLDNLVSEFNPLLDKISLRTYGDATVKLDQVLKWLWDVAVEPVLQDLGFISQPKDVWPRICWVATGTLSNLPFHAAGYHINSTRNALDRVISSYATTITALFYAREETIIRRALIVGMPTTPGQSALENVNDELDAVKAAFSSIPTVIDKEPTKQSVRQNLQDADLAHFACHGKSVLGNPSASLLLLTDWKIDPLTVVDIVNLKVNARLAFLSACHAARTREGLLVDEGIHLAGAFQLAGFPHVIGTLWHVDDAHSVEVARDVYSLIGNDVRSTAEGLHYAVRALRDRKNAEIRSRIGLRGDPLVWATYIHMGR